MGTPEDVATERYFTEQSREKIGRIVFSGLDNNENNYQIMTKRALNIADQLLEAGYKSPEEIALMYNPDYLDFKKGVAEGRKLERARMLKAGYFQEEAEWIGKLLDEGWIPAEEVKMGRWVKLEKDQTLPSFRNAVNKSYNDYMLGQEDMLKAGWRKVEVKDVRS